LVQKMPKLITRLPSWSFRMVPGVHAQVTRC
jgi:hypothetical protein